MLFNSLSFVALVIATFGLYYLPFLQRWQRHILVIASFIFYAFSIPTLLLLLLTSIGINIASSYLIVNGKRELRRVYSISGVTLNLVMLAFFKYSPLFSHTFFPETSSVGAFLTSIPLPVGISFFTFQGISLVVDTFRSNRVEEYKTLMVNHLGAHALNTTLFIAYFPQLVAGPIVKAHDFLPQIQTKFLKDVDWEFVFRNVVMGYFLKMVVADNLKDETLYIEYPYYLGKSALELLSLLFGYSMQIFADFAGYSLIAIGIAVLFGYRLYDNFLFPYISRSFSEFWRRWHISLSTFLKEYLYLPLGGNRMSKSRTYLNLMIVMFLGGLWHGAAWSYAIWGTFHGVALALERLAKDHVKVPNFKGRAILEGLMVFIFVTFAWLLFKLPEFTHVIGYIETLFTSTRPNQLNTQILLVAIYSIPVILYHFYYLFDVRLRIYSFQKVEFFAYGTMLFLILTNSGSSGAFIYFQF